MLWSEVQIDREVIPSVENMIMADFLYYAVNQPGKIIGYSVHLTEKFPHSNYVECELPSNQEWKETWGKKKLIVKFKPEDLRLI